MKKLSAILYMTLAQQLVFTPALAQDMDGDALYAKWCTPCHGVGEVASVFLDKRYQGAISGVLEERSDLSTELVLLRIRTPILGMPAFRPTEISDHEAQQIAEYLAVPPEESRR